MNEKLKYLTLFVIGMMLSLGMNAQSVKSISGTVTDDQGEAVISGTVKVKNGSTGTITDINGKYTLSVPSNATLVFSYIGYITQEFKVSELKSNVLNVVLQSDTKALDEVVVVGYGTMRKSDLTGSISTAKGKDMLKAQSFNALDGLKGKVAGVNIFSNTGQPGGESRVIIRGISTINASASPLYVVDGVVMSNFELLNPNDIESIEVLKDASATAVYGSRGANGVLLVTTKNPDKDKLTVSFNAFANIKTVAKYADNLSPYEYANLVNEFGKEKFGYEDNHYYSAAELEAFKNGTAGFDYSREIFRTAVTQNYELSIAGGGEKTTFLASLRYQDDKGIIKESDSQIYSWRLKMDTKIKKWLTAGLNIYGHYRNNTAPRITQYDGLIQQAMYFPSTISPKKENGEYNNAFFDGSPTYNPMGYIWESNNSNKTINNRLQGYVQFNILDGLTFRSQLGVLFDNRLNTSVENEDSYYNYKNKMTQGQSRSYWNTSWLNTNTLSYVKEFNKNHRINATAVFEQSYDNNYNHTSTAYNLDYIDRIGINNLAWSDANLAAIGSDRIINTLMSGMLRVNYVFMNRYMITASIRADGSSRLKDKWCYFPSAALAWDLKQENFLKENSFIDQLKLRLGYGSVGNQSVEAYRIYSKMSPVRNSDGSTSYKVDRPAAPYLKWERNDQVNVGIDFGILNGRVRLTADWYNKVSKDILLELAQPTHMGYSSLLMNSGEIKNTGVEFTISADPFTNKDFNWHTDLTLAHNKGTYASIPTPNHRQQQAGNYQNQLFQMIEGEKLGTFWGYTFDGIWQEDEVNAPFIDANGNATGETNGKVYGVVAGNSKYIDVNKDGKINTEDQGIIGCGQPTFNWGWNNSFNYKNFDFSFFVVGFHGFDIYNATKQIGFGLIGSQQVAGVTPMRDFLDRWTPTHTNTNVPGFTNGGTENKDFFSTRFVENGSFIKMKSITLGYTLPELACKALGISNLRVYASIQNPFHITSYSGLDPEATMGSPLVQGVDWGAYPNSRNYLIGLNFAF